MKKQTSAIVQPQNEGKQLVDFTGKTFYVGIDIHKKSWHVGILCDGVTMGHHPMAADAQKLIDFLGRHFPGGTFKCAYECSSWGFNLLRRLQAEQIDCIVVHAADVPGSDKEKKGKTDTVDALRLAKYHAAGLLTGIAVPPVKLQQDRNLIRYRSSLLADLNRTKNRIKALLKFEGIPIPEKMDNAHWSKNFITWLEQLSAALPGIGTTLELMTNQALALRGLLLTTEKKLRTMIRQPEYAPEASIVQSVPGIGPLTTATFLLEVGDIRRFKSFDQLNSFVGFYPGCHNSGQTEHTGHITRRRHNKLRSLFIEAAWQAIRRDPVMLEAYTTLTRRMKGQEAIVRIARKLLRRTRAVLLSNQYYQPGLVS